MQFNHDTTKFPLTGNHQIADCIQCHNGTTVQEEHQFKSAEEECFSCHLDIHFSGFGDDCERCHNTFSWNTKNWVIKHDFTLFPLSGAHSRLECDECHFEGFTILPNNLSTDCLSCHNQNFANFPDVHGGNNNCIQCHNTRSWKPIDMSHHDLIFPIYSSKHRGEWSDCSDCHANNSYEYQNISCGLNGICHDHRKSKMDKEHRDINGYLYQDLECLSCHPNGSE